VTTEKDRSEGLGERIRDVDPAGDVVKRDDIPGCPFLDGEVLDVDVTSSFGRLTGIGEVTAGDVVSMSRNAAT